jgi:hypothetical protein
MKEISEEPLEVRLYDNNIAHTIELFGYYTFTGSKKPQSIFYIKDRMASSGISVFTDDYLNSELIIRDDAKFKVIFLVESRILRPVPYKKIREVAHLVDLVVTHDMEVVENFENAVFVPYGGSWATEEEIFQSWEKNKLISCIASRNTDTEGHLLRHFLIYIFSFKYKWDLWGKGYKKFNSKADPLAPYMYTVAIQNGRYSTYFTEILTDAFLFRTIPIFWGAPDIDKIFDNRGFYCFQNEAELQKILNVISPEDYASKIEYVENNYGIALKMRNSDELLAEALRKFLAAQ